MVALGSNLPGRFASSEALLQAALEALGAGGLKVVRASSIWRSAAWPDPGAPEFRNQVVAVETKASPAEAMAILLGIERAFGRERAAPNAARTLDLDLIDHEGAVSDGVVLDGADLTLPHPRAHERRFVMGPLAEIDPAWRHPVLGRTAEELAGAAEVGRDARPLPPRCNMER